MQHFIYSFFYTELHLDSNQPTSQILIVRLRRTAIVCNKAVERLRLRQENLPVEFVDEM